MAEKYKDLLKNPWDCKEVDWDEYESHRPPYTKELYDILFQHHDSHNGRYDTALDTGAGGGTVTKVLLQKFQHVVFSDPSEDYNTRAQARFSKEADVGSISFVQRKFDEFKIEDDLPGGKPVDMITAGTCIHFGDAANLMAQFSPLLRSGGTVSAFSYGSVPIAPSGDPAGPLIKKCKEKMMLWIHENVTPVNTAGGTGTGQSRYHNVEFDPANWKDVRRITSLPNELVWPEWVPAAPSRARETDSFETVHDDFITKEVGFEFFPTYFYNFAPQLPLLDEIEAEMEELKEVMGKRKIVVKWPFMMVLATKI